MDTPVIEVHHITKKYKLYRQNKDRLLEAFFPLKKRHTDFFALNDINFSLSAGDSLGIIGENGSGKSTLLKIISGVLSPSSGEIKTVGSMGCLLELGGGFNPELTGRENIQMQMLINGEKSTVLENSIISFADIGNFIDVPVKKYSSGMFMRLAFASATAINPSILIVDEALAVGDVFFVKKCMQRIYQLLENNTTLIFVSHDMESTRRLCSRALWLNEGKQMALGPTKEVAEKYIFYLRDKDKLVLEEIKQRNLKPDDNAKVSDFLVNANGQIDLANQNLFINGNWNWEQQGNLRFRVSNSEEAAAAFRFFGTRLNLSFLQGGGFNLPTVLVDGKNMTLKKDFDDCYPNMATAPPEVRSTSMTLEEKEHEVFIKAEKGKVSWLGGECNHSTPILKFETDPVQIQHWAAHSNINGDKKARITKLELFDMQTRQPVTSVRPDQLVCLRVYAERLEPLEERVAISFKVENSLSINLFNTSTMEEQCILDPSAKYWVADFAFCLPLKSGIYTIAVAVVSKPAGVYVVHEQIDPALQINVHAELWRSIWGEFYNPVQISVYNSYNSN